MRKIVSLLALGLCLLPVGTRAAEFEFSVAHPTATTHPVHIYTSEMFNRISERSGGRIEFHIYDNNTLVKLDAMYKALKSGGVDIGLMPASSAPADMPYTLTHDMSFISSDATKGGALLWEMQRFPEIQAELERSNTIALFASSGERPAMGALNTPIRSMEDLRGKRVLIWHANFIEEIKGWGGIPVHVSIPDTYVALQRGMGEVLYAPMPMFVSMKLHELIKYLTIVPSSLTANWWLMNKDSFASLPPDLQKIMFEEAGAKASTGLGGLPALITSYSDRDLKIMAEAGIEIIRLSDEELEPWRQVSEKIMEPYWIDILTRAGDPDPKAWMEKIRVLAAEVEANAAY